VLFFFKVRRWSPDRKAAPVSSLRPEGITHPAIDDLLERTDSKYSLVIYSAKRARQINAYFSQLGEGLLEYVGPLVETHVQEKPLSIAMREIDAGLLTAEPIDPTAVAVVEIVESEDAAAPVDPFTVVSDGPGEDAS
jgi:DNA-directed RNA polymerase subunit omega